jgi:small conductance mechanosensitive channel
MQKMRIAMNGINTGLLLAISPAKIDKLYDKVYDWILAYGPGLLAGVIVLSVGLWLIRVFVRWMQGRMTRKEVDPSVRPFLMSMLAVALRILLILGVMQIIGVKMTLFAALVGAFGVAAGLALSGTLQNFASGVLILLLKPFVVGDNIIAGGFEGTVITIQIFYTMVKTFDNRDVIVPNGQLSNNIIVNTSREGTRRLDLSLKFANNIDYKQVKGIINGAIDKCKNVLPTPERRIGIGELQPDGYLVSVNVWLNAHGFQDQKMELQEVILDDLKGGGVKIPGM